MGLSAAEHAYEEIRSGILDGTFRPGERLREEALASSIGVSRTPIREALRRLAGDQFVRMEANSGVRVAEWSEQDLGEIFALRALLEGYAASLAARRATTGQVDMLRGYAEQMLEPGTKDAGPDLDSVAELNSRFHDGIAQIAGNQNLRAILSNLKLISIVDSTFHRYSREQLLRSLRHHLEIVDALATGDAPWAKSVMRSHVLAARNVMISPEARMDDVL